MNLLATASEGATGANTTGRWRRRGATLMLVAAVLVHLAAAPARAASTAAAPLQALPTLDLAGYTGTWYQVAWFRNRFQSQCVSDTTASYSRRADGAVDVLNRCKLADGRFDEAQGLARPAGAQLRGDQLQPAQLEVSFLPAWLRWLPIWGDYWAIQRADDGRYVVISEGSRTHLWVLSREPRLSEEDAAQIRTRLLEQGFDLSAWQTHGHTADAPAAARAPEMPKATEPRSARPALPPPQQTR